ncbi:MAG TPA: hypothetical protein VN257_11195 [Actinotalea sp.]|nr:hypothetical protein [Actinotalea sp.]
MPARPLPGPDPAEDPDEDGPDAPDEPAPEPRASTPEPTAEDVETSWRDIVTRLGELEVPDEPRRRATDVRPSEQGPGARTVRPAVEGPRAWVPDPDVEEAETHFEPPEPGPVLGGDPLLTIAWAMAVGVPALLLIAVIVWRDVPAIILQVAGVGFLAAVGVLLWRMPRGDDEDRGTGAVV